MKRLCLIMLMSLATSAMMALNDNPTEVTTSYGSFDLPANNAKANDENVWQHTDLTDGTKITARACLYTVGKASHDDGFLVLSEVIYADDKSPLTLADAKEYATYSNACNKTGTRIIWGTDDSDILRGSLLRKDPYIDNGILKYAMYRRNILVKEKNGKIYIITVTYDISRNSMQDAENLIDGICKSWKVK